MKGNNARKTVRFCQNAGKEEIPLNVDDERRLSRRDEISAGS